MSKENRKCFQPPPPASFSPLQVNDEIEKVVYTSLSGYQPEQGGGEPLHQKTAGGEQEDETAAAGAGAQQEEDD